MSCLYMIVLNKAIPITIVNFSVFEYHLTYDYLQTLHQWSVELNWQEILETDLSSYTAFHFVP